MITTEKILELAEEHLEHFSFDNGAECAWTDFAATKEQLIEFAQQIRRDTLYEVIHILSSVPNPEANRTAINRITMELD